MGKDAMNNLFEQEDKNAGGLNFLFEGPTKE